MSDRKCPTCGGEAEIVGFDGGPDNPSPQWQSTAGRRSAEGQAGMESVSTPESVRASAEGTPLAASPAQTEPTAPSVDVALREVERRLREMRPARPGVVPTEQVARRLVAAARCGDAWHDLVPDVHDEWCPTCGRLPSDRTGVDPTRLEAALREAGEG